MTRKKTPTASLVRSSAAEYLTFVAASGTGGVEAVYADENVWLSQKMMAQLYDVEVRTINYHLKKVFEDSELEEDAVIRSFRITAADGVFSRRGIIEAWGRGTIKMAELAASAGLPRPEIEDAGGCVTVRFRPSRYVPPQRGGAFEGRVRA